MFVFSFLKFLKFSWCNSFLIPPRNESCEKTTELLLLSLLVLDFFFVWFDIQIFFVRNVNTRRNEKKKKERRVLRFIYNFLLSCSSRLGTTARNKWQNEGGRKHTQTHAHTHTQRKQTKTRKTPAYQKHIKTTTANKNKNEKIMTIFVVDETMFFF